jgi:malate dehydrogenase (oxaloacetate-decarboxylating)
MAHRLLLPHNLTIPRPTFPKITLSKLPSSRHPQTTMASQPSSSHPKSQSSFRYSSQHKQENPNARHPKFGNLPLSTSGPQDCALTGSALLNTPYFNKGAGFPPNERKEFKLTGLLPQHVSTLEEQVKRAYQQYSSRQDALAKNTFMTSLAEQNTVLYFRVSGTVFLSLI